MAGEDFQVLVRVSKTAGISARSFETLLESLFTSEEDAEYKDAPTFFYARDSKIAKERIVEISGVKRKVAAPVILETELFALQTMLARLSREEAAELEEARELLEEEEGEDDAE